MNRRVNHSRNRTLELNLTPNGTAELYDEDDDADPIWTSDEDDDFKDAFPDEFLSEKNAADIVEWLVDNKIVTEAEGEDIEIFEESETDAGDDGDDDGDDEDEE